LGGPRDAVVDDRAGAIWARILAYVTGTVDQELLVRNEYLAVENRIFKAHLTNTNPLRD